MSDLMSNVSIENLISLVLVIVTGVYVFLTWRISKANKQLIETMTSQFRETIRPYVSASIAVREGTVFFLEIKNTGKTPARNLRLSMSHDFFRFGHKGSDNNIKDQNAFTTPIDTFSPGERLSFDLAQPWDLDKKEQGESITPSKFSISADYSFQDVDYKETFIIDTAPYMSTHVSRTASEHLAQIESHLKQISASVKILTR